MAVENVDRIRLEWSRLTREEEREIIEELLEYKVPSEFVEKFIVQFQPWLVEQMMIEFLRTRHLFKTIACYWEQKGTGQFFAPEIVKAAENYENACMFDKALELYRKGIEVCSPSHIDVYDEGTGGCVSATNYPELNRDLIEKAEKLVEQCRQKVKELEERITFEEELKNPHFSDEDAKVEFYNLAKGVTPEIEEAMMRLLGRYRPLVACQIKEELERL